MRQYEAEKEAHLKREERIDYLIERFQYFANRIFYRGKLREGIDRFLDGIIEKSLRWGEARSFSKQE